YWCFPSIKELAEMSCERLSNIEDFIIGRVGYGQLAFNCPVDLTAFRENLQKDLFGGVIIITNQKVQVYSSSYPKPARGSGLNVPATITIENMAPVDPETKKPILDPTRAEVKTHVKKLKSLKGMKFLNYYPLVGTWIFQVQH
ncbi:hypothetical protein PACTADRAFT_29230, partial [Pachysolen tannophilus NRRL Y-2460]